MKRPTYILGRFYYPGKEHPELKVAYIKNNLVFRWLFKYNFESITLPDVTKENLEASLPSFWGEMRRYALSIIYDTIHDVFSSDFEDELCSQTAVFHSSCLNVDIVSPDVYDDGIEFVESFGHLEFRELLTFIEYVKPEETDRIANFKNRIKYHYKWRRQMSSKEVCAFDNNRDNEDDEFDID